MGNFLLYRIDSNNISWFVLSFDYNIVWLYVVGQWNETEKEEMEGAKNGVHVIFQTKRIFSFKTNIHKIKFIH